MCFSGIHKKALLYMSSSETICIINCSSGTDILSQLLWFPSGTAPTLLPTPDERLTLRGLLTGRPTITERVCASVRVSGWMAPLKHLESIAYKGSLHTRWFIASFVCGALRWLIKAKRMRVTDVWSIKGGKERGNGLERRREPCSWKQTLAL